MADCTLAGPGNRSYTGAMKLLKNLFTLGLLGVCTLAAAQWQWLDKDGRKVFSDRAPPVDILDRNILKRPGNRSPQPAPTADTEVASLTTPASGAGAPTKEAKGSKITGTDNELEAKRKQAADAEAANKKAEDEKVAKAKIENCASAKQAKATLDSGVRIGRVNTAGEREVFDESARAAEAKRIQALLSANCS